MKLSSTAGTQGIGWAQQNFVGKSGEASATISKGHCCECTLTALEPDDDQEVKLATAISSGIYCIALEEVKAGKRGLFCLSGKVEAMGGTSTPAGGFLMPQVGGEVTTATGNDVVYIGVAVDLMANATLGTIIFDGFQLLAHRDT